REERGVAARVIGDACAVQPYARLVVDGAEVEEQALVRANARVVEAAPIPTGTIKAGVADAAGRCLGREGHADCVGPGDDIGTGPTRFSVHGEFPLPVE